MADSSSPIILKTPSKYAIKTVPAPAPPAPAPAPTLEVGEGEDAQAEEESTAAAATDDAAAADESPESTTTAPPPSLEWLTRTWTVTHSTLAMWRSARNVRITYKELPAKADGRQRIDDVVEYEPSSKTNVVKTVAGVDTQSAVEGGWDWRGRGLLFFVSSHWEVLAWGEETTEDGETERWAVTWFAPTLFTKEGLDVYCDRREGLSEATYRRIDDALKGIVNDTLADLAQDMMPVDIKLPWIEK